MSYISQGSGIGEGGELTSAQETIIAALTSLGSPLQILRVNAAGTAIEWAADAGAGTVTSVSVTTANGVSGSVATATTTPAITLTLGEITPSSVTVSGLTASEIVATNSSKALVSLAVATYPSLTELTYVKGVTSAIQTQINTKAPSTAPTFATSITGSYLTASEILITDSSKNIVSAAVATYPSLTELTYVKGVTSAIQTQLNAKGVGDMVLASVQSVTGLKTFDDSKLAMKGSSTGIVTIATANAGASNYIATFQAATGTVAYQADVTYIGTTSVALNRTSAALTLAGITLTTPDIGTPSAGTLTNCTGLPVAGIAASTVTALGVGSIELGHATDTTIARSGAGAITVEGVAVLLSGGALGTPSSGTGTNITGIPAANILAGSLGAGAYVISTSLQAATIELGHATDTTLARVSAGVVSIEGVNVLTVAGGTLTGNITLGEGVDPATIGIVVDNTISADERYSGITTPGTAGATLAFGDICYLDVTATEWLLADASVVGTAGNVPLGICVDASTDGAATSMLLIGTVRSAAFPASVALGAPVYVSETAGDITATAPTTTDSVMRRVGWAVTAEPNTIYFNPSNDYITHT